VRWKKGGRWWHGVVLSQDGDDVTVMDTAKGEDRIGGKVGTRPSEDLERDGDPVLVLCSDCTTLRASHVPACFCGETEWELAPKRRTDPLEAWNGE
jgi:hypothetical protein